jgi:GH35 family endo-1,4-beta-xylanase
VDQYDFSKANELVDFAVQQGLRVHGHVMIRDTLPGSLPSGLAAAATSPEKRRRAR